MKPRIKWSNWVYNQPIRIKVMDWKQAKVIKYGRVHYLIADCKMEYKGREFELCVPWFKFKSRIQQLRPEDRTGFIEIMKTPRREKGGGMIIRKSSISLTSS